MPKPTVVLVHGAWHTPEHYAQLTTQLRAASFSVHAPLLPSCGPAAADFTKADDDRAIQTLVHELVERGQHVILLCHSYGGAIATQAVTADLSRAHRRRHARPGGVVHLVYMAAFLLRVGESARSISQPRPDPEVVEFRDDGTSFIYGWAQRELFFGDVEPAVADAACAALVPHGVHDAIPVEQCAWKHVPATYLRCTLDQALLLHWQDGMIRAAREAGAEVEVETFAASHSPFLSMPGEMVAAVERVAAKYAVDSDLQG